MSNIFSPSKKLNKNRKFTFRPKNGSSARDSYEGFVTDVAHPTRYWCFFTLLITNAPSECAHLSPCALCSCAQTWFLRIEAIRNTHKISCTPTKFRGDVSNFAVWGKGGVGCRGQSCACGGGGTATGSVGGGSGRRCPALTEPSWWVGCARAEPVWTGAATAASGAPHRPAAQRSHRWAGVDRIEQLLQRQEPHTGQLPRGATGEPVWTGSSSYCSARSPTPASCPEEPQVSAAARRCSLNRPPTLHGRTLRCQRRRPQTADTTTGCLPKVAPGQLWLVALLSWSVPADVTVWVCIIRLPMQLIANIIIVCYVPIPNE